MRTQYAKRLMAFKYGDDTSDETYLYSVKKKDSISNDRTQRSGEAAHAVLVLRQNNYKYTAVGHQRFTIKVCIKYYLC